MSYLLVLINLAKIYIRGLLYFNENDNKLCLGHYGLQVMFGVMFMHRRFMSKTSTGLDHVLPYAFMSF